MQLDAIELLRLPIELLEIASDRRERLWAPRSRSVFTFITEPEFNLKHI
jgi:hypothetical protein